jgi:hypothetical protein
MLNPPNLDDKLKRIEHSRLQPFVNHIILNLPTLDDKLKRIEDSQLQHMWSLHVESTQS